MAVYYLDENKTKLKKIKDNQYLYDDDIDYNSNNVNINYNINKSKYEEAKANNDFIQSKLDTTAKKYIEQEKLSNNDIVNEILSSEDYKKPLTTLDKRNLTTTVNSFYNGQRETTSGRNTIQSKKNELFKDKNLTVEEQNKIINLIVKNPKWSERYKNIIEENGVNALSDAEAMLKNEKVLANYQENVLKQPLKKTNVIEQIFTPITSGVNSILTGMDTSSNRYVDEKGKTHFLPTESDLDLQRVNQSYGKGALGVAGKVYSAVANSGSKILTSAGINTFTAGIGGSSAYFGSIIGNSYKEAINNGATNDKAILNGLSKAGLEYVTGRILGSTTSALTSQFTGKATSELGGAISNKLYKLMGRWPGLANAIGSGISEGLEEFIQTPIEHAIDLFTIGKDGKNTNLGDLIKDSDIWAEAMFSGVVGGLTGGLLSPLNSTAKQIKSLEVFRNLLTEDINEIKQNKNYDQTKVNKLETLIKSLDEKLNTPFTLENNDWNNLGQEIQEYSQEKNKISANPLLNNDSIILPKNNGPINTETNDGNIINDNLNINGENISLQDNNFIDSANRNNIDTTSRDFNLINQFLSNRGLEARFDTNMFNNNEENALYGISEQGQRYVIFNPNSTSSQRIQSIAVHEVYHDLVNSGISSEIENIILKNASTKQDFDKAFDNLKEIYSTAGYDINDINFNNLIKEEATASILGQKLGNNEFIESVIKYDKNIFAKLHNIVLSIVNFLNKLRGYKDEKLLWKEIANKYKEYYKNNFKLNETSNATLENKNNVMKSITANDDIDIEDTFKKLTKNDNINSSEIEDTIYKLIEDNSYDIENKSHALLDIDKIAKEKDFNISTSPYSFSIYAIPKNEKVDWNYKPKDSYRLSDHWNFFSEGEIHCKLTNEEGYTHGLILAKYNGKTYDIVKDYRNSQNLEEKYQEQIDDYIYKNSYKEQQWEKAKENTIELFKYEANKWYESEKKELENQIKNSLEDENTDFVNFSQEELEYFNDTFENGKNLTPTTIKDYIDSKYDEVDYNLDFSLELLMEDLKRYNVEDKELTNHLENNEEKLKKQNELHKGSFSVPNLSSENLENSKFSKTPEAWQDFLDKNYPEKGTGKLIKELKMQDTQEDSNNSEKTQKIQDDKLITKLAEEKQQQIIKRYENKRKEIVKGITKEANNFLEFDNYMQKNEFRKLLESYYDNNELTTEQVKADIKKLFGTRTIDTVDDTINDIRRWIKTTDLQVDDDIKRNIIDFNEFNKYNFNKLKLKNNGISINKFYQEISSKYPDIFNPNISNKYDQLYKLSEFMNQKFDKKIKEPLYEEELDAAAKFVFEEVKNHTSLDELLDSISLSRYRVRKERIIKYREEASDLIKNSHNWKDTKFGVLAKISTMKRNFYDVMGEKDGQKLYSSIIEPIFNHNAIVQKEITKYNQKILALNINNIESTAVQMLGEYKYNPYTNLTGLQVEDYISSNKLDYDKISNAVEVMRNIYDELLPRVNKVMKSQGLKEIPYRKGYFPHFMDEHFDSKIGKGLEMLGWKAKSNDIPTDIAGITEVFTPNKVYTSFAQKRKGKMTDYNALKGFDKYIRGAMELIYFTEDIQKLRALENQIRYEHSPENIQEQIDQIYDNDAFNEEDRQILFDSIWEKAKTPLNNFVSNLRDYTNMIANKKSVLDRTMENLVGRKYYGLMQNVSNRLSANMVGANIGSSLTNFIPVFRATSQVKTKYILKGIAQSINNLIKNDGFDDKSVFLTTRLNSADVLYKTKLDKISEKANFMFEGIDSISSNIVVRSKYLQNIAEGMSEFQAMRNADEFGRDLMAGRSKGEMPTLFNSKNPLIKIFTAFQLEVNNDFQYMLKDIPRDMKDKTKKALVSAFVKMFIASWIYNQITKKIMGRETTVEPISKISNTYNTLTNINLTGKQKQSQITKDLLQEAPFIGGLLGGGRLPTNSLADPMKIIRGESTVGKEAKNLLYYTLLPFGGGQLKKIQDGASMYINNKQIKGKYNNKGDLLYEAKKDPVSISKNILFGQYSTDEAREYFENGYSPINKTNQQKIIDSNISVSEYRKIKNIDKNINRIIKSDKHDNGISIKDNEKAKKVFELMNKPYNKKEINFLLKEYDKTNQPIDLEVLNQIPKTLENYKLYFNMSRANREKFVEDIKENNISVEDLINYYNKIKDLSKENLPRDMYEEQRLEYIKNTPLKNEEKWLLYFKENSNNNIDKYNLKYDDYYNVTKLNKELKNMKNPNRKSIMFNYINNLKYNKLIKQNLFSIIGYGGKK
nr:MAG TPA: hypothetical protein [Caudoviricetes sp.]